MLEKREIRTLGWVAKPLKNCTVEPNKSLRTKNPKNNYDSFVEDQNFWWFVWVGTSWGPLKAINFMINWLYKFCAVEPNNLSFRAFLYFFREKKTFIKFFHKSGIFAKITILCCTTKHFQLYLNHSILCGAT